LLGVALPAVPPLAIGSTPLLVTPSVIVPPLAEQEMPLVQFTTNPTPMFEPPFWKRTGGVLGTCARAPDAARSNARSARFMWSLTGTK
jgi:hypothetical protein